MSPKISAREIHLIKLILTIMEHSLTFGNARSPYIHDQGKM